MWAALPFGGGGEIPSPDRTPGIIVPAERQAHAGRPTSAWSAALALGAALAIVGGTDLFLLLFPPHFGDSQWEFVIVSNVVDAMPVPTVGLTLLAVAASERPIHRLARALAIVAGVVVLVLLALGVVYLLDVPVALRMTPPQMKTPVYRALLKSGVFGATYVAYYTWLAVYIWRRGRVA